MEDRTAVVETAVGGRKGAGRGDEWTGGRCDGCCGKGGRVGGRTRARWREVVCERGRGGRGHNRGSGERGGDDGDGGDEEGVHTERVVPEN